MPERLASEMDSPASISVEMPLWQRLILSAAAGRNNPRRAQELIDIAMGKKVAQGGEKRP